MEHNTDSMLRKKVLEAEQRPADWNKEEVWSRIAGQIQNTSLSRSRYFYAAASVGLIALSIWFAKQYNTNATRQEIIRLEAMIQQTQEKTGNDCDPAVIADQLNAQIVKEEKVLTPPSVHSTAPEKKNTIIPGKENIPVETIIIAEKQVEETMPPVETDTVSTSITVASKPERIQPIIGFYEQGEQMETVARKKRNRIRLFEDPENKPNIQSSEKNMIIARIK